MVSGPIRRILAESGHIAGIINPPAPKKRGYWINENDPLDLDAWLAARPISGQWWLDWLPGWRNNR
jgi:polyhydroxyalkanoate synthase